MRIVLSRVHRNFMWIDKSYEITNRVILRLTGLNGRRAQMNIGKVTLKEVSKLTKVKKEG